MRALPARAEPCPERSEAGEKVVPVAGEAGGRGNTGEQCSVSGPARPIPRAGPRTENPEFPPMITMEDLLALLVRKSGSDLHISVGTPPRLRIDGVLVAVETTPLTADDTRRLATSVLTSDQIAKLDKDYELDCSFELENQGRFRANVFYQRGAVACVLRLVPHKIADFDTLGLPRKVCERICGLQAGLVLVTGATG